MVKDSLKCWSTVTLVRASSIEQDQSTVWCVPAWVLVFPRLPNGLRGRCIRSVSFTCANADNTRHIYAYAMAQSPGDGMAGMIDRIEPRVKIIREMDRSGYIRTSPCTARMHKAPYACRRGFGLGGCRMRMRRRQRAGRREHRFFFLLFSHFFQSFSQIRPWRKYFRI